MGTTEYRVDDLARAAGMTVRNVRAYQERGLLPPPLRRGRTSWYDENHLGRLRLIGKLHDEGYTSAHIAEFISSWEAGRDLGQSLGLEAAMMAPGSGEIPEEITLDELVAMTGGVLEPRAVDEALRMGILIPTEGDRFLVRSPRLLRAGAQLIAMGMPLLEVLDLGVQLRLRVAAVAELFVTSVAPYVVGEHEPGWVPTAAELPRITGLVEELRPLARVVVDEQLADTLQAGITDYVTQWLSAAIEQVSSPSETR